MSATYLFKIIILQKVLPRCLVGKMLLNGDWEFRKGQQEHGWKSGSFLFAVYLYHSELATSVFERLLSNDQPLRRYNQRMLLRPSLSNSARDIGGKSYDASVLCLCQFHLIYQHTNGTSVFQQYYRLSELPVAVIPKYVVKDSLILNTFMDHRPLCPHCFE